jgi:hypothetical protein
MSEQKESAAMPPIQNILANAETRDKFCGLLEECLLSLTDVFPECQNTRKLLEKYQDLIKSSDLLKDQLIKKWHRSLQPHYALADAHDNALWDEDLPYFQEIHIRNKWYDPDFTEESKDYMWEYMTGLNKHSRIYNAIPEHMLDQIQNAATGLADRVRNGEMKFDLESLNWQEVEKLGKDVMSGLNEGDVEEFVSNITGLAQGMNLNSIQDIPRVLNDIPGMSNLFGGDGAHNFGDLLNQIFQSDSAQGMMGHLGQMMGGAGAGGSEDGGDESRQPEG